MDHQSLLDRVVVAVKDQMSCDLAGEVVVLNLVSGLYYGLDSVGARIWGLIQEPTIVRDVRDALLREYEVEPGRCEEDLVTLLRDLTTAGLVEVRGETSVPIPTPASR